MKNYRSLGFTAKDSQLSLVARVYFIVIRLWFIFFILWSKYSWACCNISIATSTVNAGIWKAPLSSRIHTLKTEPHTPAQSAVSLLFSSVEPGGRNIKATIACSLAYLDWVPLAKSLKGESLFLLWRGQKWEPPFPRLACFLLYYRAGHFPLENLLFSDICYMKPWWVLHLCCV